MAPFKASFGCFDESSPVPVSTSSASQGQPEDFPLPEALRLWSERFGDSCRLTPLPQFHKPLHHSRPSATWRLRRKLALQRWRVARSMVKLINGLDKGNTFEHQTVCTGFDSLPEIRDAQKLALQELWFNASVFARARRDSGLTGDHAGPPGSAKLCSFFDERRYWSRWLCKGTEG